MSWAALIAIGWAAGQFATAPVADPVLASQRGGFALPNGIDVAIAVDTQTAVNGAIVLRTSFRLDQGTPTVTVYVPKDGETVPLAARSGGSAAASQPTVTYDARNGIMVTQTSTPNVAVTGGRADAAVPAGMQAVTPGSGVVTDAGALSQGKLGSADAVTLSAGDLSISHLTGGAFGSAITNTGNDRAIDTETTMSIALGSATPDNLGSAMFRAVDVGTAALQTRMN